MFTKTWVSVLTKDMSGCQSQSLLTKDMSGCQSQSELTKDMSDWVSLLTKDMSVWVSVLTKDMSRYQHCPRTRRTGEKDKAKVSNGCYTHPPSFCDGVLI